MAITYLTLRFNWLYRTILAFSCAMVVVLSVLPPDGGGPVEEPFGVIADYPKGCNGGFGSTSASDVINILEGSCVYMMEGVDLDGVKKRGIGMIIKSYHPGGDPGDFGTFKLEMTAPDEDFGPQNISIEATGSTMLSLGNDEIYLNLYIDQGEVVPVGGERDRPAVRIRSRTLIFFEDAPSSKETGDRRKLYTRWYHIKGAAGVFGLYLYSPYVTADKASTYGNIFSATQTIYFDGLSRDRFDIR
ncbi:hypothetical protein FOZ62_025109, partial [Perkinsus olseni]